jgi:anti-sigma factor (TIGR02949 family)
MTRLDRTNCEEAFRRLDDYFDRRLESHDMQIIEDHLKICAWCAREFNFEASVLHGVRRKMRELPVSTDLMTRILAQLPSDEQPS